MISLSSFIHRSSNLYPQKKRKKEKMLAKIAYTRRKWDFWLPNSWRNYYYYYYYILRFLRLFFFFFFLQRAYHRPLPHHDTRASVGIRLWHDRLTLTRATSLSLFPRFFSSCRRCPRRQFPFNERNHCRMWLNPFSWRPRHRYPGRKSVFWAAWGGRRSAGRLTRAKDSGPILCCTWSVLKLKWVLR